MKLEFDASGIPPFGATGDYVTDRIKVYVKFFTPSSCWTWYMTEYSPETREGYGLVCGLEKEFGYFSLDELESVVGPMGLGVEVDKWWAPKSLEVVMKAEGML
jgi:hypothetical protein